MANPTATPATRSQASRAMSEAPNELAIPMAGLLRRVSRALMAMASTAPVR